MWFIIYEHVIEVVIGACGGTLVFFYFVVIRSLVWVGLRLEGLLGGHFGGSTVLNGVNSHDIDVFLFMDSDKSILQHLLLLGISSVFVIAFFCV